MQCINIEAVVHRETAQMSNLHSGQFLAITQLAET